MKTKKPPTPSDQDRPGFVARHKLLITIITFLLYGAFQLWLSQVWTWS